MLLRIFCNYGMCSCEDSFQILNVDGDKPPSGGFPAFVDDFPVDAGPRCRRTLKLGRNPKLRPLWSCESIFFFFFLRLRIDRSLHRDRHFKRLSRKIHCAIRENWIEQINKKKKNFDLNKLRKEKVRKFLKRKMEETFGRERLFLAFSREKRVFSEKEKKIWVSLIPLWLKKLDEKNTKKEGGKEERGLEYLI